MCLFFSLEKLERLAQGSDTKFLQVLEQHFLVKCKGLPKYLGYKPIPGKAFLLNAEPLFSETIDPAYVVQYVKLAARRDYTNFTLLNDLSLDTTFFPDIDFNRVKRNPLLLIKQTNIYFKHEEIYYGAKFRKNQR